MAQKWYRVGSLREFYYDDTLEDGAFVTDGKIQARGKPTSNYDLIRLMDISEGINDTALTTSPTWTGVAAPATETKQYAWRRNGYQTLAQIRLDYVTPGTALTKVEIPFPADLPAPAILTGVDTGEMIFPVLGYVALTQAGPPVMTFGWVTDDGAGSWKVVMTFVAGNYTIALCNLNYLIAALPAY